MQPADRLKDIEISPIRRLFEAGTKDSIHLGIGQPDFQPPKEAIEAFNKSMQDGLNKYGPVGGIKELRVAIAEKYKMYKKDLEYTNVIVTAGATEALMAICMTYINPGDEVLIPNPHFVVYDPQIRICGGIPVQYSLNDFDFLDSNEILEKITNKTKAIIINSPNNPTGWMIPKNIVKCIAEIADDKNLLIISDEVYDRIVYDFTHNSFLGLTDNVICVNSFSKTYCMTGWRIGFIIANYVNDIMKSHYYLIGCPNTPVQYAALAALQNCEYFVENMMSEFYKRRYFIVNRINEIDNLYAVKPAGTFYIFPKYTNNISSLDLALKILKNNVIVTPGSAFGNNGENHIRISYANSLPNIEKGLDIIENVLKSIK